MSKEKEPWKKCHFCGAKIFRGSVLKRGKPFRDLYVCEECDHLIAAILHDSISTVFEDLTNVVCTKGETYEKMLESWQEER